MNNAWIVAALVVVAAVVLVFVPPVKTPGDEAIKLADATPEAQFLKALYPALSSSAEEVGCVPEFLKTYVKDITRPLVARSKELGCGGGKKDWLVSYSATGISDTGILYVGLKAEGGDLIGTGFISPYDDVYVLNYSFGTVQAAVEKVLNKSGIVSADGWAVFFDGETRYLVFTMPYDDHIDVLLYIEKTPEYNKQATMENLRSEVGAAHKKFVNGERKFTEMMHNGFLGNWTVTTNYLYYPDLK